jgi:hypothetical protein
MSTGAETQAIPRVPTADAGALGEVAPSELVAGSRDDSVQQLYEAGLTKLHTLHERWAAAVAEIREAQVVAA